MTGNTSTTILCFINQNTINFKSEAPSKSKHKKKLPAADGSAGALVWLYKLEAIVLVFILSMFPDWILLHTSGTPA